MTDRKRLLVSAVCLTVAAISGWMLLLMGRDNVFQILSSLCFTLSAGIGWKQYTKKQQEE